MEELILLNDNGTQAVCRFNVISIKIPMAFFTELEQIILKFVWKYKRPRIAKITLRKKNKAGGIMLPDFKPYYKATVIQNSMVLAENRHKGQWNRIKSPELSPQSYGQLIYKKKNENTMWKR